MASEADIAGEVLWLQEQRKETGEYPSISAYTRRFGKKEAAYRDRIKRCKAETAAAAVAAETVAAVTEKQRMLEKFGVVVTLVMGLLAEKKEAGTLKISDTEKALSVLAKTWDRTVPSREKVEARGRPTLLEMRENVDEALRRTQYGDGYEWDEDDED